MPTTRLRLALSAGLAAALSAGATTAHANPEFLAVTDARAAGMGGGGVASSETASSVVTNPAGLDGIERYAATVTLSPVVLSVSAPLVAPDAEQSSDVAVVPLFFAGGGFRVSDRVVVGASAFVRSGAGAEYTDIPELGGESLAVTLAVAEASLPVSVRVNSQLTVGAALRFAYAMETTELFDTLTGAPVRVEQDLDGFGLVPGVAIGAIYRPLASTRIGASYRSQMSTDMEGTTTMMMPTGAVAAPTRSEWATPHAFHLGGSHQLGPMTVSTEAAVKLYDRANDSQPFVMMIGGAESRTDLDLSWKRTVEGHLGAEYRLGATALRAGYGVSQSATPRATASAFSAPPGTMHAFALGTGARLADIQLDIAAMLFTGGAAVDSSVNGPAGRYEFTAGLISVAGTFLR